MTRHHYDRRGRLTRSVTEREPEWTEQDQAEILALAQWRAGLCPCGCGHPYDDVTSPEDTGPQFVVTRATCRARMALQEAQDAATTPKTRHTAQRLWAVHKRG